MDPKLQTQNKLPSKSASKLTTGRQRHCLEEQLEAQGIHDASELESFVTLARTSPVPFSS